MTPWLDVGVAAVVLLVALLTLLGRTPVRAGRWPFAATLACLGLAALTSAVAAHLLTILFALAAVALGIVTLTAQRR